MQQRALTTQANILQAALREFAAKGFSGARMDVIAQEAGVNKQRIYAYFQNKEQLFSTVIRLCFEKIGEEEAGLQQLHEEDAPRLGQAILQHYLSFHDATPEFWRLIAWENLEGGQHAEQLKDLRGGTLAHLRTIYQAGQARGIFHPQVSFETYIFMQWAISFFYYANQRTLTHTLNLDLSNPDVRQRIMQECLLMLGGQPEQTPQSTCAE
jgi:TetR/AcrR family transcriptional regulator